MQRAASAVDEPDEAMELGPGSLLSGIENWLKKLAGEAETK